MHAGLYVCDSKEDSQRKTRTAKPYRMFCYADALPKISSFVTFTTLLAQIQEEEHLFTDSCNNRRKQTGYLWHNVSLWAVVLLCSNNGAFKEIIIFWLCNLRPYMDFTIPIRRNRQKHKSEAAEVYSPADKLTPPAYSTLNECHGFPKKNVDCIKKMYSPISILTS